MCRPLCAAATRAELRAVASLNSVELITALISCNRQLGLVGLQLRILNGVVSLLTTEVHNKALAQYLSQQRGAIGSLDLTTATLEVLACIAFKATPNVFGVRPLFAGRLCTTTFAGFTRAYASRTL
jgi:chromosome segregation and condensation protein ScpB